ncbi:cephalosporin hydroxylase family protein [bacterium]|nr:cephalosporin hydroxylase family protein [bacterium]
MNELEKFQREVQENIAGLSADKDLVQHSQTWLEKASPHRYSYNFRWMGRPIIQLPQDILAMQELIWTIRPEVIVETGVAHGGSAIFYASMLELVGGNGKVLGVDIDIRSHNRAEIEKHPLSHRIDLIQGSSTSPEVMDQVRAKVAGRGPVLVTLDSNHTHEHVLEELRLYSPLVTRGSYLVVFDTVVEDMPDRFFANRPWKKGNSPKTAVWEFLKENARFEVDTAIDAKLMISVAPEGYLRCVRD